MSDLSLDKLMQTLRQFNNGYPNTATSLFDVDFTRKSFAGYDLHEAPSPQPKIQFADIKFDDGTSILSQEFRFKMNAWLLERFGMDDIYKDKVYLYGNHAIVSRENMSILKMMTA